MSRQAKESQLLDALVDLDLSPTLAALVVNLVIELPSQFRTVEGGCPCRFASQCHFPEVRAEVLPTYRVEDVRGCTCSYPIPMKDGSCVFCRGLVKGRLGP